MSLRRGIFWCASGLPAVALGLLPLAPASAQRDDEPETEILSHEEGTIIVGRDAAALPWARSASGPLVALGPVVDALGGDLERGPLGEAHTLRVAGRVVVVGPLSRTVVVDDEVHNLSIRPWIEPEPEYPDEEEEEDGEEEDPAPEEEEPELPPEPIEPRKLFVPVDALARAYPETLGYRFDFDRRRGLLRVDRTGERRLDVEVDRVHDLGATTLVVTFSNRPRFQVERYRAGVRLRLLSGVLEPRRRVRLNDPLVRWIEVRERSVDVGLAPLAEASEPYLLGRPPRVQLVFDITRRRPGLQPRATSREQEERREFRIVLDPGHGGTDNGVRAPFGESEKNLALGIAEALRSYLEFELGARVVLTRNGDSTVTLENRTSLANQYEADLFVSLHVGAAAAAMPGSAFQTWVLDPPPAPLDEEATESEDEAGPKVAEDEPRPDREPETFEDEELGDLEAEPEEEEPPVVIPPLEPWDRVQDGQLERSALLARLIQTQVGDALGLPNRGFRHAPLRVLTGASMPAVLIEFGYEEVVDSEGEKTPVFDGPRGREVFEAIGRAIRLYRGVMTGAAETTADGTRS
ncbi:MAG: N-acetylmuramoyl-L-alanine amidase [Holophagales bacterium]|nr:N-acetylmuramoyl-L-alanine amidase [Holophagales bacterium]MYF95304.1 N-acetylmuramoyl-L-alanine amidase [Holophagales bacterium]